MPQENKYSKTLNFITESQLSLTIFQLHFFVFNFQCHCEFLLKQINVSFSCVCPVIDHEFRHNIVKVSLAVDPRGDSRVDPQTILTML